MADFDDKTKLAIVLALARFETPSDIVKALAVEGISSDPKQIGRYDPTRTYFEAGPRWKKIFEDERERYMTDVSAVPIANQGFRLNSLQRTYDQAMKVGNKVLANSTLRQAAEEVGGALTNERNVNVRKPVEELSADERRAALAELVRGLVAAVDPPGSQPAHAPVQ